MSLSGNPISVLVVEDNPTDFLLLKECIADTQISISKLQHASTFEEAVKAVADFNFSIILLDLSLPDTIAETTFSLLHKLTGNIPVVILSARTDHELALQTIKQGAQDYLIKDKLEPELLKKTIFYSIERNHNREQLRESERRFRYISEHFPNGTVCFLDKELRYVFGSGGGLQKHKIDAKALHGQKFSKDYPAEETARIEQKLMGAFAGKEVLFEIVSGRQVFLVSAVAASSGQKDPENILVISQNITDLKHAEERVHFQSTVLENITDAVIITDMNKKVTFWNNKATSVYGYEEAEMIGRDLGVLVVDANDGTNPKDLLNTLDKKGFLNSVVRRKTKDGRLIWVEVRISYNYDVNNKVSGLIGVSKDITAQRAEEHLLKLFQSVIINSHDAVVITEANPSEGSFRKIVFVNEAFSELTGFVPSEVIGNTMFMLVGPKTDKDEVQRIELNFNRWQSFASEISFYRKDGSTFWVDVTIMPVSDETGVFTHWVFIQRDITADRESAEKLIMKNEQLTTTNRELDRFVYSASHDLRAPLTSVLGLISLMRKEKYADDAKVFLDKIQESVDRLDRFIQNIINYSRNSRLVLKASPINFKEQFDTAVAMHKFMDHSRLIRFEYENKCKEDFISDPDRWQIILNNLVSNGIKFARANISSFIRLSIRREDEMMIVEISDNGTGITKDQLDFVFQMFYRANSSSEGSGLGLYIVKQTVELFGGTISVESESMVYTRFIIQVPLTVTLYNPNDYAAKSHLTT